MRKVEADEFVGVYDPVYRLPKSGFYIRQTSPIQMKVVHDKT